MIIQRPLSEGPETLEPEAIVVHSMGEYIEGVYAPDFLGARGLSAHALGTPDGHLIRCREDNEGAWHCKAEGMNFKALGYEFLVPGNHNWSSFKKAINQDGWVREKQFLVGARQIAEWAYRFTISVDRIFPHSVLDPENKVDPGKGFPWERLLEEVALYQPPEEVANALND